MYRIVLKDSSSVLQKIIQNPNVRKISNNPTVRQAGFGRVIVILTPIAVAGGVVAYSKYDPEFRNTVEKNIPGAESVLKVLLQEEKPFQGVTKSIESFTSQIQSYFDSGKPNEPVKTLEKPVEHKRSQHFTEERVSAKKTTEDRPPTLTVPSKGQPRAEIRQAVEVIPSEITELEEAVDKSASLALQEYNKAIKILKSYNEDVKRVVDDAIEKVDVTAWNILKNKTGARDNAVENAERSAVNALQRIEKCENALGKAINSVNKERVQNIRNKISKIRDNINVVKDELFKTKDSAILSEKYWKKVESARSYYINEIESIFPGLSLSDRKINLSKNDLDLFLIHAYSHVLAYQKELQRLQIDGEIRLKKAIDTVNANDQSELVKSQVEYYLEKEKQNLAVDNQKKIFQIRAELEKDLRHQLKRQSAAHFDHLQDALSTKEAELRRNFSRELDEKLSVEKTNYKLQLAEMLGKLRGMEVALKERADSEKCAHQAQSLWAACQSLWASVRSGEPGVHWREKLRPLKSEIKAVKRAAAEGDELVTVIIDNLPKEAKERGVYPEDALRERFINVERIARRLALVPAEGATLPTYILSYIQSLFILTPNDPISQEELQDMEYDFSKLDTFDVLNRARYYMDRGDLTQTLKYMNLLQGASRKIASDWMKEARLLLETQQAAHTLMAHAAASGFLYL